MNKKSKIIIFSIIMIAIVIIGGIIVAITSKKEEGITNTINTPIVENKENTTLKNQTTQEAEKNNTEKNNNEETEEEKINNYIKIIYGWSEVYGVAIPEFDDINDADELWLWDRLKKSKENSEYKYSELEELKKQIYGNNLQKKFPTEGSTYLIYDTKSDMYLPIGIGLDEDEDSFVISSYTKEENNYIVEIIEYLVTDERYNEMIKEDDEKQQEELQIIIKNINGKEITKLKNTANDEIIKEYVKNNKEKFTKKQLVIEIDGELLHIKSVKNI